VFAAKAGAKHVYAIEASELAEKAREIIKKNGFSDIVTYVCLSFHTLRPGLSFR